ncbi:MAG TPA: phage tail length tape measure family protein [Stellaceae bacterium]|nr:phage tail length tape measure family protein [Stellaceae bacterium]
MNHIHDALVLAGRGLETNTDDLARWRNRLQSAFDLSNSDARALTEAFGALPGVTLQEANALATMAVEVARAKGLDLGDTIKQIAAAASRSATAVLDLGRKWGLENDAAAKNVKTLEQGGQTSQALSIAIKSLSSAVDAQVGAWTRATAAAQARSPVCKSGSP